MANDYFSQLMTLMEATNEEPSDAEIERNQEIIADTGSDVNEENPNENNENYEDEIEDTNYLNTEQTNSSQLTGNTSLLELEKKKRLFDLFKKLLQYADTFYDSVDSIDVCMVEYEKLEKINKEKNAGRKTKEKIETYIVDGFNVNNYDKSLYIYILLRTELLTIIQNIRKLLLNSETK